MSWAWAGESMDGRPRWRLAPTTSSSLASIIIGRHVHVDRWEGWPRDGRAPTRNDARFLPGSVRPSIAFPGFARPGLGVLLPARASGPQRPIAEAAANAHGN